MSMILMAVCAVFAACDFPNTRGVLVRFAGEETAAKFEFARNEGGTIVDAADGKIRVRAPNENMASAALGRYIREIAKGHFSRQGNRVPKVWPLPAKPLTVERSRPQLHAYNYCVFSYSFAYYDEQDWRENIDRLALSGYNTALVVTGNCRVWQLFMRDAGYTEKQIADYISDEIAFTWTNCGGLETLGAPVPDAAIQRDARLGRFIVREMRALGIEPMIQGFTGLLPRCSYAALSKDKYPDVRLLEQGMWCGGTFRRPILLDATTETYSRLAKMWYRRLFEVFGINDPKYFVGNLFSEGGIATEVNCPAIAAAMQREQQKAVPGVTWCISCWNAAPRQDLINGLDPAHARIIVLDRNMANGGKFPRSFGPFTWIWGELLNFGNNDGIYGGWNDLENLHCHGEGPDGKTLCGYASESEGVDSNPWFYELFTDLVFRPGLLRGRNAAAAWIADYAKRRYGTDDARLVEALSLLRDSAWHVDRSQEGCNEALFCARPKWNVRKVSAWATDRPLYYNPADLENAARRYHAVALDNPGLLDLPTFRFDYVDLFRQVLADRANSLVPRLKENSAQEKFLALIDQTDELVACEDHFRLDVREARIRRVAGERGIRAFRRMLTTWTDGTRAAPNDYAHRQFSGLLSGFYARRWREFFTNPDNCEEMLDRLAREAPSATFPVRPRGNLINLAAKALSR